MNLNQIIVLGFASFLLLWVLYPENEVHEECCKTVAPLTEEQKEIQNEFNEKRVSMDTNEIHIDNHEIDVKNEVWRHSNMCKECLKRQGF
jgi:hypothetical protein